MRNVLGHDGGDEEIPMVLSLVPPELQRQPSDSTRRLEKLRQQLRHEKMIRQTLDDLKVWQWHADYPDNGTKDGEQWSIDVAYADHAIKAHGDNNYPDATGNGTPNRTETFNRYLDAVKKLIGGKTFQ